MNRTSRTGLLLLLLSGGISILWGVSIGQRAQGGAMDFRAVYYGTRCLLEHHNPYKVAELESVFKADDPGYASESGKNRQLLTLYVNLPTTFLFVAPLAMLPYWVAQAIWLLLIAGLFLLTAILMGRLGESFSAGVSVFLICVLLVESEHTFALGNTAGLVIGLCALAVWCLLRERYVTVGVLCLAASLAIKPHDAGLVWLYFLLAGGMHRKRALQALAITVVLSICGLAWMTYVAPNWIADWSANMATISGPNGLNNPGPGSVTGNTPGMVIDLQAAVAVFRNDPRMYNAISYAVCGAMLLVWVAVTLKRKFSPERALYALAAVVPLTMLITYHRPYDAKLLLVTIPACAMVWAEGRAIRWVALLVSTAGIVMTGELSLAVVVIVTRKLHMGAGALGMTLQAVATRPGSFALLAMAVFYLWVYVRQDSASGASTQPEGRQRSASAIA